MTTSAACRIPVKAVEQFSVVVHLIWRWFCISFAFCSHTNFSPEGQSNKNRSKILAYYFEWRKLAKKNLPRSAVSP
jgi:hypothetical protein